MGNSKRARKSVFGRFFRYLKDRFDLTGDNAAQEEVIESMRKGVEFKGTNLWVLIFATFIASLGLNVNSTAVIIGAMLISPLMGPIMGIGLSLGINDFQLMKKSLRNFLLMVVVSILTSTFYFLISPYSSAQSELLARTSPTIYDVLIAFTGGLAGMLAQTRKDRAPMVISGVAIATALMPPLCTAGFGIANGEIRYILGAFYLFLINAVFIAVATYIMVVFFNYDKKVDLDKSASKRMKLYMVGFAVLIIVPSAILTVNIIRRTTFESSADRYVKSVFQFNKTMIVDYNATYHRDGKTENLIEIKLVGETLTPNVIDNVRSQLPAFGLHGTELIIMQADEHNSFDFSTIQKGYAEIIDEKNRTIDEMREKLTSLTVDETIAVDDIAREAPHVVGNVKALSLAKHVKYDTEGNPQDTTILGLVTRVDTDKPVDSEKLKDWLGARIKADNILILTENPDNN